MTQWYLLLADRLIEAKKFPPALEAIDKALSVSRMGGGLHLNAELYRPQGVALSHTPTERGCAIESFSKALAASQSQGAGLFKLRTLRDRLRHCPDTDWLHELQRELNKSRSKGDCIEHNEIERLISQFAP